MGKVWLSLLVCWDTPFAAKDFTSRGLSCESQILMWAEWLWSLEMRAQVRPPLGASIYAVSSHCVHFMRRDLWMGMLSMCKWRGVVLVVRQFEFVRLTSGSHYTYLGCTHVRE